jgi:transcriptional regulator with XRE-family HTH domain
MVIGARLRALRESKHLSQGDIEKRTNLFRCYTSRVENGHTVPSLETLEKYARALEIPMYQLMYDGENPPTPPKTGKRTSDDSWECSRSGLRLMEKLRPLLRDMKEFDRKLILHLAGKTASRHRREE